MFGVNFADGRIKCYPTQSGQNAGYFVRYVRGDVYGQNSFSDLGNNSIQDKATGLIWQATDSGEGLLWDDALGYCEDLILAGLDNWRLPNAKELHSIVDYTKSPDTTNSPALDSIFDATSIKNEAGETDWPFYWSSTTHRGFVSEGNAAYISFGRGMGNMSQFGGWIDVHGAGAQRSDPKTGVPSDMVDGHGPQGDAVRSENYIRCVSGGAQ